MVLKKRLLNQVIDIEVAARTPSPTVDPSVRTILIGHSMGGIVAAETVVALTSDRPVYSEDGVADGSGDSSLNSLMFPYVQGVLAFDTPYLGIAPAMVAHGAEGHYTAASTAASTAISQISALGATFWGAKQASNAGPPAPAKPPVAALPAPPANASQAGGGWGKWGKVAMYAGAAGAAIAAGGTAAYLSKDHIGAGLTFVTSHLEFVGCLAKGEDLRKRVAYMVRAQDELGIGFANFYTRLGAGAKTPDMAKVVLGKDRTFCNLPAKMDAGTWKAAVNEKASDEAVAHMSMFEEKENPGYDTLAREATGMIAEWARNEWYEGSGEGTRALLD